ncbi:MAG: Ribonuclease HI [candidate division TA06 bacterium 32_111]|uniref:Ribonuclease HI n=2 Tax=Bacteria candidate phyla TaxID=1783234 RepID=A0A101I2R7_UNCT6|nr:MAG: Ribonuclease HI [candidate division TA06 bacterium 32_111]KUK87693.1 MAG: Ribonuclease HI [candidate division TA06 bacterium 34_109]HAF07531.1 ribonuclease HI [candidate division WOR-3 bacterium]HCP17600.1 ribonuclease HI [candidate division WOR-3 bacterium]
MKIVINFDGGCKNNPGPAAFAFKISFKEEFFTGGGFFKNSTNNRAEWSGLLYALREVQNRFTLKDLEIEIYSDSELVVKQLKRIYRVKDLELKKIFNEVNEILSQVKSFKIEHIPREENKECHKLVEEIFKREGF